MSFKKNNKSVKALLFLLSYIAKHKVAIFIGILFLLGVDIIQLIIPVIIQNVLDSIKNETFTEKLIINNSLLIIGSAVLMVAFRFLWRLFVVGSSRKIETEIRKDLFKHLTGLSFSYFNKTKTGDLMALMINDLRVIRMAAGPALIGITDTLFLGIMTIMFMARINIILTLFALIPLSIIVVFIISVSKKLREKHTAVQESFDSISSQTQEMFSGIRVLKGFAQEETELENFKDKCNNYMKKSVDLARLWGGLFPLVRFVASLTTMIFILTGGLFTILKIITIGEFVAFNFFIANLIWPMIAIGWVFNLIQQGIASTIRVMKLLDTKTEIKDININNKIKDIKGKIEIKNLTFSYNESDRIILKNINLKINKGQSLGIIGKPGSGKTTLVSLLFKLYKITKGKIKIDGFNMEKIPIKTLRSSIGYIPQDSFLFSDTIKNNIELGLKEKASIEKINKFLQISDLKKDINRFKNKEETIIGERGVTLSGGQRQRLSIARALILDPKILILDDALSSVDTSTEQEILTKINDEIKKRTTIIIAHRISTIKKCDNIIVMDEGIITEQGTHEELLKNNGYYKRLYDLQKLREDLSLSQKTFTPPLLYKNEQKRGRAIRSQNKLKEQN